MWKTFIGLIKLFPKFSLFTICFACYLLNYYNKHRQLNARPLKAVYCVAQTKCAFKILDLPWPENRERMKEESFIRSFSYLFALRFLSFCNSALYLSFLGFQPGRFILYLFLRQNEGLYGFILYHLSNVPHNPCPISFYSLFEPFWQWIWYNLLYESLYKM